VEGVRQPRILRLKAEATKERLKAESTMLNSLTVWQLADSAFPTGGFAHSSGLEAAWQMGEVPTPESLDGFVRAALWQAGRGLLPLASSAHLAPRRLEELDEACHVFLINTIASRASCVQGRAFAATCARVWPRDSMGGLEDRVAALHGHLAPVFGAALSLLGLPLRTMQQLLLYSSLRGLASAAVRLGIVGTYAAQRLQVGCAHELALVLERCEGLRETDIAQTAPILDLLQAGHDRLYSRLFQS
jgi:urease accessory protein